MCSSQHHLHMPRSRLFRFKQGSIMNPSFLFTARRVSSLIAPTGIRRRDDKSYGSAFYPNGHTNPICSTIQVDNISNQNMIPRRNYMTSEPLPSHLPLYCMSCGASLIYTEISTVDGEGSASWKCSGCGEEDKDNWSEFDFTPIDQTNQSAPEPDIEFKLPWPDYPVMLPPPPPLSGGLAMPLTPSYSDIPEDARIVQEQFLKEIQERNKRYEALMRQIEADGVVAIVRAAHFPLFALSDLQGRF